MGISRITVTLAYHELVADDYITSASRSGYFVSETAPTVALPAIKGEMIRDTVDWDRAIPRKFTGGKTVKKNSNWRSYPYPFMYGQPDPDLFNQASWRLCAMQALGKREFDSLTSDYAEEDDPELINFIMRHTLPRRGILARPEQILVTVGAQNALWMTAQILLNEQRSAAFENPGYHGITQILRHTGCMQYPIDIDADGLPPSRLPQSFNALFITPSHQCPTTTTMPMDRRHELLRLASERNFLIVEDDYEFEMSFIKSPSPALKSLDTDGRGDLCRQLFKVIISRFAAGLSGRIGTVYPAGPRIAVGISASSARIYAAHHRVFSGLGALRCDDQKDAHGLSPAQAGDGRGLGKDRNEGSR